MVTILCLLCVLKTCVSHLHTIALCVHFKPPEYMKPPIISLPSPLASVACPRFSGSWKDLCLWLLAGFQGKKMGIPSGEMNYLEKQQMSKVLTDIHICICQQLIEKRL